MNTKLLFIPVLMSLMASGVSAQTEVIDKMNINTDVEVYEGKSFYTSDIDSIVFYKGTWMYGNPNPQNLIKIFGNGSIRRTPVFPVSEIKGIEFSFRDSRKLYAPKFVSGSLEEGKGNTVSVGWEYVPGVKNFELAYSLGYRPVDYFISGEYKQTENTAEAGVIVVPANKVQTTIENLNYGSVYSFAIRAISSKGEELNSDWSIRNTLATDRNFMISTAERYVVPKVLSKISRTEEYVRVGINLSYDAHKSEDINNDFANNFEISDGKFVADEIWVRGVDGAEVPAKWAKYKLTAADVETGYIDIDGLEGNGAKYTCTLVNSNVQSIPDSEYNTITIIKKELFGEPILIQHRVDPTSGELNASRLDTIINNFMNNGAYDDGKFYLEGGKAYYLAENVYLSAGITLETDPADLAIGKRAIVYLPHTDNISSNAHYYFMLGKIDASAVEVNMIEPITFRNIDFDCPGAYNYGEYSLGLSMMVSGNYFINSTLQHEPFTLKSLNIENCTFQRFIRGFVRLQGNASAHIEHINCDGNIFYDCGYYAINANDYGFFYSPGLANTNIYSDFRFTNNTIYDSPKRSLIWDNNRNIDWSENEKWNITIENNTLINFSTIAYAKYLIDMRYVPNGSYFSVQRNLFVLVKNDEDGGRTLYNSGADIRSGEFTFDVKDNYSVGCLDSHLKNDGIFTVGAFSATKNSFGMFPTGNKGTAEDLIVKVGSNPLRATDLFNNPNPPYNQTEGVYTGNDHKAPDNIMEALKYKQTPEVLNHEIYTKNIGDQRWK